KSFEEEKEDLKEEKVEETQDEPKEVTSEDAPNIEQTPNDKKDE
ncbi:ATP-dependent metalloprotease FtsH, partial [Listeria innocua FSL J1-023]